MKRVAIHIIRQALTEDVVFNRPHSQKHRDRGTEVRCSFPMIMIMLVIMLPAVQTFTYLIYFWFIYGLWFIYLWFLPLRVKKKLRSEFPT